MDVSYKKRPATSGVSGQLYETKLISLLLFRLLHNDDIKDFYLASNMDDIGAFDDVCVKIIIKGHKPTILFIQAKHKDNDDKLVVIDNNNDLVKWSDSISKIKQKFGSGKSCDTIFSGKLSETECIFILYTNGKWDSDESNELESSVATHLNDLLVTKNTVGIRPLCTEQFTQDFSARICKEEISILAERLVKYLDIKGIQSMNIMNDEHIVKYHVILATKVFNVSEIQGEEKNPDAKWRQLTFQPEFINTRDEILILFKEHLYEVLFSRKPNLDPGVSKKSSQAKSGKKHVSPFTSDEEEKAHLINTLLSLKIKVPVTFGNKDLSIRGNAKKIESRLNHLANFLISLCQGSKPANGLNVITIDDTIDEGLLSSNGGLGGIVGNILIYDEDTKLYKFIDSSTSLMNNAKTLYCLLQSKIDNIHEYRIVVKTSKFPRLSFDYTEVAKDFFANLVVYAKQSNHYELEDKLKKEIDVINSTKYHNSIIQTDSVFLYYHNEIQKWWMSTLTGTYLTKSCDIYLQSLHNILIEPQMSRMQNVFNINKIKNIAYAFNENAMQSLNSLDKMSRSLIVTDVTTLTSLKLIQYLRYKNIIKYTVIDLEFILNMNTEEFNALILELKSTEKIVIIVCDIIANNNTLPKQLEELLHVLEHKRCILVIHNTFAEATKIYFTWPSDQLANDKPSLVDLNSASQRAMISKADVIFQGFRYSLEVLLDNKSIKFIDGAVLDKIIHNETITIGETLSNTNYEKVKLHYIERTIKQIAANEYDNREYKVKSLFDLTDDSVLITAEPGMGKSTLLTHLSLKTKELDGTFWIVRINLLDYTKEFSKWQEDRTFIDRLGALKFICLTVIKTYNLEFTIKERNHTIYLEDCNGDEFGKFELNIFLNLYNKRKIILLLDGFDEICPHYLDCAVTFLDVVMNLLKYDRIWVTSSPYSEVISDLRSFFRTSYEIGYFDDLEQEVYLKKIWLANLEFKTLKDTEINNVLSFINFIQKEKATVPCSNTFDYNFFKIYNLFYIYLYSHFPHIDNSNNSSTEVDIHRSQLLHQSLNEDTPLRIPLLLYLVAAYFVKKITSDENRNEWKLCTNIHNIYTMFIETKLKAILFQDENSMDVYNPNAITLYEKEKLKCYDIHKKLAINVFLKFPFYWGSNLIEVNKMGKSEKTNITNRCLEKYLEIVKSIGDGTVKAGLISHITNNDEAVFIHRTFAEYFFAEFIYDIFMSDKFNVTDKHLLLVLISTNFADDILPWIHKKKETDDELCTILKELEDVRTRSCWLFDFSRNIWRLLRPLPFRSWRSKLESLPHVNWYLSNSCNL